MTKYIRLSWSILIKVVVVAAFFVFLLGVIAYARGYRLNFQDKGITSTGILSISSNQKAAKIFINGELKGVTDTSLTLPPGEYNIEVKKAGYTDWTKKVVLKGEIVMTLDATQFPRNPSLSPVTNQGIVKAVAMAQSGKILLFSENDDPEHDGIYIFESNQQPISFFQPLKLIALKKNLDPSIDFKDAVTYFKPDFTQSIIEFGTLESPKSYLFNLGGENTNPIDTSTSKDSLLSAWKDKKDQDVHKVVETFPKDLQKIASDSFKIISFSPDEDKILYIASKEATLPQMIPTVLGANQTPEERTLKVNQVYIYDRKEDKNFAMPINYDAAVQAKISVTPTPKGTNKKMISPTPTPQLQPANIDALISWLPDSNEVVIQQDKQIVVRDYDGTNEHIIYSGPFEQDFFAISSDGKLFVLSNLNPQNNKYADLYEVGIK